MSDKDIAERFLEHNFHDALFRGISIVPPHSRRHKGLVVVTLEDTDAGKSIELKFISPATVEFAGNFEVLKDNTCFGNTSHTAAIYDRHTLVACVRQVAEKTNIEYIDMASPVDRQVSRVGKYTLFLVFFMGGTLKIVAEDVKIKKRRTTA